MENPKSFKLSDYTPEDQYDDIIDEITADGSICRYGRWFPIETVVRVYRESKSGLAFFGDVRVYEKNDYCQEELLFQKDDTWIPISVCDNPWWICTIMFGYSDKVSNKSFEDWP